MSQVRSAGGTKKFCGRYFRDALSLVKTFSIVTGFSIVKVTILNGVQIKCDTQNTHSPRNLSAKSSSLTSYSVKNKSKLHSCDIYICTMYRFSTADCRFRMLVVCYIPIPTIVLEIHVRSSFSFSKASPITITMCPVIYALFTCKYLVFCPYSLQPAVYPIFNVYLICDSKWLNFTGEKNIIGRR